ncbi:MAG: Tn3 family transposase [Chthoniobacterales bacterium]
MEKSSRYPTLERLIGGAISTKQITAHWDEAAIALWNTVYLERAISALQERSYVFDQKLLVHLSPLKWEHINLTGDYHWRRDGGLRNRKLRPLRSQPLPDFAS